MGKFNVIQFRNETRRARINSFKNIALNAASTRFVAMKTEALEQFDNHPITKEIEAGPNAANTSRALGGKGNLFSFLGFEAGEQPVDIVREILRTFIQMERSPIIEEKGSVINFKYAVNIPNIESIYEVTPLNWENGRSWVRGIEKGISGFAHYLYWRRFDNPPSRSGTGVQVANYLRNGEFSPTPYLSKIINDLRVRLV